MPGGVINPKGRNHLNETSRDMTPREKIADGRKSDSKDKKQKPLFRISKTDTQEIKNEIRRLFKKENFKKSKILMLLKDKLGFNKVEAENLFFYSFRGKNRK